MSEKRQKLKKDGTPSRQGEGGGAPSVSDLYSEQKLIKQLKKYLKTCESAAEFTPSSGKSKPLMLRAIIPTISGYCLFVKQNTNGKLILNQSKISVIQEVFEKFKEALSELKQMQEQRVLEYSMSGMYNPTIAKLVLMTNHGYTEATEDKTKQKKDSYEREQIKTIAREVIEEEKEKV